MDTLGKKLKAARQKRKLTASEAAKGTRIKVQHIEAIENDDFSSIAAPTYAKGFIRIYAEFLGMNPEPLIEEYTTIHTPQPRASLIPDEPQTPKSPKRERKPIVWPKLPQIRWREWQVPLALKQLWTRLCGIRWQPSPALMRAALTGLAVIMLVGVGVVLIRRDRAESGVSEPVSTEQTRPTRETRDRVPSRPRLPVIDTLPEPYLK